MGQKPSLLLRGGPGVGALYQGGKASLDGTWLEDHNVGACVSLGSVALRGRPGVRRVWVAVGDVPESACVLAARLPELVQFVADARVAGLNVLVHCAMGASRSSAVVVAYVVATGVVPDVKAAMTWLCALRPLSQPNAGLMTELAKFRHECPVPDRVSSLDRKSVSEIPAPSSENKWTRLAASMRKVSRKQIVLTAPRATLRSLSEAAADEASDLWKPGRVDRIRDLADLSPVMFARDYVAASRPVVFEGRNSPLDVRALVAAHGDASLTVSATPDGRADAIAVDGRFAKPQQRIMALADLVERLGRGDPVLYYSAQNDCLRTELPELIPLFEAPPLPATYLEAFAGRGTSTPVLEAVNCWLGDAGSVTTAHMDRAFENLYLVLDGTKTFYVLPPTAPAWLPVKRCRQATWTLDDQQRWDLVDDAPPASVQWLDCGDLAANTEHTQRCKPLAVTLAKGDLLYIPAGWVHQVHQADRTLAVNWWYEARFDDARWAASHLAAKIGDLCADARDFA